MSRPKSRILKEGLAAALLTLLFCTPALANNGLPSRGKVVIIRGAFTVFSLGMNDLGDKLRRYGYDVDVIADISAGSATSKIISEYRRNPDLGPIVFIGHSRGAELGPKQSRKLQRYGIPVKLVVMVDGTHRASIPANVEHCVNLFHYNSIGVFHGVPTQAEGRHTKLYNVDINRLESRHRGGMINHFNMDSSPWIHDLIISEVLRICPLGGNHSRPVMARNGYPQQPIMQNVNYNNQTNQLNQPYRAYNYPVQPPRTGYPNQQAREQGTTKRPVRCCRQSWIRYSH